MKIAFWSHIPGRGATTSNMACLGVLQSIITGSVNILMENHCALNDLEHAFSVQKKSNMVMEELYYYGQTGMDGLMKRIHSGILNKEVIENSASYILKDKVYYIPKSRLENKDFFEYELNQVINRLLHTLDEIYDMVYIDTAGQSQLSTKLILEEADIVVVNLSQDEILIRDYFDHYKSLAEKAVYLIGNYDPASKWNLKNIIRKYSIEKDMISVIPYSVDYHDALSDGTVAHFLMRNYGREKEDANFYFMKEAAAAVSMLERRIRQIKKERVVAV